MGRTDLNKKLQDKIFEEELEELRKKKRKRRFIFWSIFILCILAFFSYMRYIGTSGLIVKEYTVKSSKIPNNFHGFKIVHFSDLHYGSTINEKELKKLVDKINLIKPDLIVFTGDLIDEESDFSSSDANIVKKYLNKLEASTGKYAVKGQHDYSKDAFVSIFNETDFITLNNTYDLIYYKGYDPIIITGISSSLQNDDDIDQAYNYFNMETANQNLYTISLLHEPDTLDEILQKYNVDLALAGHSHNGQIRIPYYGAIFKVNGSKKYYNEYYKVNNTKLYVSGGLGTSSYKLRLFNRPSINLYRLLSK